MLAPFNLPKGKTLLVTDELAAPADFIVYEAVKELIKDGNSGKESTLAPTALVLSTSVDLNRWKSVMLKYSVNLATYISSNTVQFLDLMELAQLDGEPNEPKFTRVLDLVSQSLDGKPGAETLVILDDTASLEWIGHSPLDVWRFLRKLRARCLKAGATLLIRHHVASANDPDQLFLQLVDVCAYHLDVRPLYSGRSGAVSGEVALYAGPLAVDADEVKLIPRSSALQYRLTDNGPVYFDKGTSEGVL